MALWKANWDPAYPAAGAQQTTTNDIRPFSIISKGNHWATLH